EQVAQLSNAYDRLCERIAVSVRLDAGRSDRLSISRREVLNFWESTRRLYPILTSEEISALEEDFALMLKKLDLACSQELDPVNRAYPLPVVQQQTGRRGRPPLMISERFLAAVCVGRTKTRVARRLQVSPRTLQRALKRYGLLSAGPAQSNIIRNARGVIVAHGPPTSQPMSQSTDLSDIQLDRIVRRWRCSHPNNGPGMLQGYTVALGHHVTLARLVKWKFFTHAFVDGFSRCVVSIRVSDNNRANTVLDVFQSGRKGFGTPSRI
ncbi:hypothetical protein CALCODRAFT_409633, partial [Calocera cornea HHB12733]